MTFLRSPRAFLVLPFLLACAGTVTAACSSTVETGAGGHGTGASAGTGGSGQGGSAGCPADVPSDGTACDGPSDACHYPQMCCADTVATCSAGHWSVMPGPCVGKTPAGCPPSQPSNGDACTESCLAMQCGYGTCPDGTGPAAFATCAGGSWSVSDVCPQDAGAGTIPHGGVCGADADGGQCQAGLVCCYPCGIPGCMDQCTTPCTGGDPGCDGNGCPILQ